LINFEGIPAEGLLEWAIRSFGHRFGIVTSFQAEGMVLLDMASRVNPAVRVLTLNTGRLPTETLTMADIVRSRYGIEVECLHPDPEEVSLMVARYGPDLFYREPVMRKLCCEIRKVRPLERKLIDFEAYAVGLRRDQSEERASVPKAEQIGGRWKLSPLADWSRNEVWTYIRTHDVPVHPLYASGYQSIGCAPCTRPVQAGEDERAGRWWWEKDENKECGIHVAADGRMRRTLDVMLSEVIRG
jgi:thioredoxin-dependent adenylylsulfate APS reductase